MAARDDEEVNPLQAYVGFHLRLAQEAYFAEFRRRTGLKELRPGLFAILAIIEKNPGINQTTLGQLNGRQKSTLTTSLRALERRGLVRRERVAADRRNYALALTGAGRAKLAEFWIHARATEEALVATIGEAKPAALLDILKQVWGGLG